MMAISQPCSKCEVSDPALRGREEVDVYHLLTFRHVFYLSYVSRQGSSFVHSTSCDASRREESETRAATWFSDEAYHLEDSSRRLPLQRSKVHLSALPLLAMDRNPRPSPNRRLLRPSCEFDDAVPLCRNRRSLRLSRTPSAGCVRIVLDVW